MTSLTFISPDGKLMTHKKYVNWEGVREVEGSGMTMIITDEKGGHTGEKMVIRHNDGSRNFTVTYLDFTIQD